MGAESPSQASLPPGQSLGSRAKVRRYWGSLRVRKPQRMLGADGLAERVVLKSNGL